MSEPNIVLTDTATPEELAVIGDGLRAYNTSQAGYDDYRPLAVFVKDSECGKNPRRHLRRQLSRPAFHRALFPARGFAPLPARQPAHWRWPRRRPAGVGCTRITLNTLEIQAQGFYEKQGYETAAALTATRPGSTAI